MIAQGEWVYGYSAGVFQVDRIVERYVDESVDPAARQGRSLGQPFPSPLVVLKRCVDGSFSPSIGYEVCDATLCKELGVIGRWRLKRAFGSNPHLLSQFEEYVVPTIRSRYGLWLSIPEGSINLFSAITEFVKSGRTFLQIKKFMIDEGLWKYHKLPITNTLFFTNYDFEIDEDRRQIYRGAELLGG